MVQKVKDYAEATALIREWAARENKPVTAQSLTDALGSRVAKSVVQKVLDDLVADATLCEKDVKKARFYYNNPARCTAAEAAAPTEAKESDDEGAAADATRDTRRDALLAAYAALKAQTRAAESELSRLQRTATAAELRTARDALAVTVAALQTRRRRLARWAADGPAAPSLGRLVRLYRLARAAWKTRREVTQRVLDAVLGEGGPAKTWADALALVDDDAAGVSLTASAVALPSRLCPPP